MQDYVFSNEAEVPKVASPENLSFESETLKDEKLLRGHKISTLQIVSQ